MFKKPKKAVRTRGPIDVGSDDENGSEGDDVVEIKSNIDKLKKEKKEKKKKKDKDKEKDKKESKKTSLLSFDDEFEGDGEFKIKKSSASRRLMKQKGRDRKRDSSEERENGDSTQKKNGSSGKGMKIVDDDVQVKELPKPKGLSWTLSGREAEALHAAEEDDVEEVDKDSDSEEEDPIKKIIQSGGIPDAAAIHAARKKREQLRAKGGRDDYIPLQKKKSSKEGAADNGESRKKIGNRLIREEDEEEADEERISFTLNEEKEEYHRRTAVDRTSSGESEGEDGWEKMQISKAITGTQIEEARAYEKWQNNEVGLFSGMPPPPPPPPPPLPSGSAKPTIAKPANYDLRGIRDRMKQRVENLKEVSRKHEMDADKAVDDLVESQSEIRRLEKHIPELAARHRVYQQLKGYITDLVDCYDEKVGVITYLESRLNKMNEDRRGKLRERRRQDVRDQADVLGAMTASTFNPSMDMVQDAVRDFRIAEREGRQRRRRQARQKDGVLRHNDGLSSDDEMPGQDQANLGKIKQDVENQARMVLDDVIDEFSDLSVVQDRICSWRSEDIETYQSAYVSVCLPKIFSPLIRMQLLFWNPLVTEQEIQDQDWYKILATYSLKKDEDLTSLVDDPDRHLVSLCVEKVLLPKIAEIVRTSYDPVSTKQTNRVVGVLNRLVADYPTISMRSKFLRIFISNVVDLIKDSLDQDLYIPMYTKAQMDNPNSVHSVFFQRQFWSALKLFRNILAWHGIIADNLLSELAVDRLLNRYLLLSLRANHDMVDAVDKARIVVDNLPEAWLEKGCKIKDKFAMLINYLKTAGSTPGLPRDVLLEIIRVLKKLGDEESGEKLRSLLR